MVSCIALAEFLEGFALELQLVFVGRPAPGWAPSALHSFLSFLIIVALLWRAELQEWRHCNWVAWTGGVALLLEAVFLAGAILDFSESS